MATWSQYDKGMRGIKQKPEVIMKRRIKMVKCSCHSAE